MASRRCPNCGHINPADASFCGECGRELPTGQTCPACGFSGNPPGAEYCINCGAPLQGRGRIPPLVWIAGALLVLALIGGVLVWQLGVIAWPCTRLLPRLAEFVEPPTAVALQQARDVTRQGEASSTPSVEPPAVSTSTRSGTAESPTVTSRPTSKPSSSPTPEPTPELTITRSPTDTPVPTVTPLPTSTLAPTYTPPATPCGFAAYDGFLGIWRDEQELLGCPAAPARINVWMAEESFERGHMLWREDKDKIYVLFGSGHWARYDDIWVEGDPEYTCGTPQSPPTPKRGFGKIWCTYQSVRDGLGNAVTSEQGSNGVVQQFTGGSIIQTGMGRTYILYVDGTWR